MTVNTLCKMIDLQPEIVGRVRDFFAGFDVSPLTDLIHKLPLPENTTLRRSVKTRLRSTKGIDGAFGILMREQ